MSTRKVSVYVDFRGFGRGNPYAQDIYRILESDSRVVLVDRLGSADGETDLFVTNSTASALGLLQQTVRSLVVVAVINGVEAEKEEAEIVAADISLRCVVAPIIPQEGGHLSLLPRLKKIILSKSREV